MPDIRTNIRLDNGCIVDRVRPAILPPDIRKNTDMNMISNRILDFWREKNIRPDNYQYPDYIRVRMHNINERVGPDIRSSDIQQNTDIEFDIQPDIGSLGKKIFLSIS